MRLFQCLKEQLKHNKPFVIYSKSNSDKIIGLFQRTTALYTTLDFKTLGFVFAPFSDGENIVIPKAESDVVIEDFIPISLDENSICFSLETADEKANFETLVKKGIEAIENNIFDKVVLSRKEIAAVNFDDIALLFQRLKSSYPNAFCSLFFHPKVGMWMGATPEELLRVSNKAIYTMALAGTQVNHGDKEVFWGKKEQEEQRYVTDFIVESLNPFVSDIKQSEPFTAHAAKVMHIRTDISGTLKQDCLLEDLIRVLHPTPAVCGMPRKEAKQFIKEEEGYDRKYYSGFLGELNCDFETNEVGITDLFVNLRCMELKSDVAYLYVGCGITKDSNPESEYIETVNKSGTMKKILN